jgi:hypothetical protein
MMKPARIPTGPRSLGRGSCTPTRSRRIAAALFVLGSVVASGCAAETEETDASSDAVRSKPLVDIDGAKYLFTATNEEGESTGGFDPCPAKIGNYTLADNERAACRMRSLGLVVSQRMAEVLRKVSAAGILDVTQENDLARIQLDKVVFMKAGPSEARYLDAAASLDLGADGSKSSAGAQASMYTVRTATTMAFTFRQLNAQGREEGLQSQTYATARSYGIIPFFKFDANLTIDLNIGSVIQSLGPQAAAAQALVTFLNGRFNGRLSGGYSWTDPKCLDAGTGLLDNDLLQSVIIPLCKDYATKNGMPSRAAACDKLKAVLKDPFYDTAEQRVSGAKMFPLRKCVKTDQRVGAGTPVYSVKFAAPDMWGFAEGQHLSLFRQQAGQAYQTWTRAEGLNSWMTVTGVGGNKGDACGVVPLGEGQVCVSARQARNMWEGECDAVNVQRKPMWGAFQISDKKLESTGNQIDWPNSPKP